MSGHRYKVGQVVEILHTTLRSAAPGHYEILRLVPLESGPPRYCLRNQDEKYERVVTEDELLPLSETAS